MLQVQTVNYAHVLHNYPYSIFVI